VAIVAQLGIVAMLIGNADMQIESLCDLLAVIHQRCCICLVDFPK